MEGGNFWRRVEGGDFWRQMKRWAEGGEAVEWGLEESISGGSLKN